MSCYECPYCHRSEIKGLQCLNIKSPEYMKLVWNGHGCSAENVINKEYTSAGIPLGGTEAKRSAPKSCMVGLETKTDEVIADKTIAQKSEINSGIPERR